MVRTSSGISSPSREDPVDENESYLESPRASTNLGYVMEEVNVPYNASLLWGVTRDTVPLECCNSEYRLSLKQVSRLGIDGRMFRTYPVVFAVVDDVR